MSEVRGRRSVKSQLSLASDLWPLASAFPFPLLGEAELLFDVNLQVRLGDLGERHADAPRSLVVEENLLALDANDAPAEVALAFNRAARLQPRRAAREA